MEASEYFVTCTKEEADNIVGYMLDAEASAISDSGETTHEASRFGSLMGTWNNLRSYLADRD